MNWVLVGLGGALGSLTRYRLGKWIADRFGTSAVVFPLGTFIINITGAILLGVLSSMDMNNNLYLLFGDGFLGAYTTFSTFMYEGFNLFQNKKRLNAILYIAATLALGVIGYLIGYAGGPFVL